MTTLEWVILAIICSPMLMALRLPLPVKAGQRSNESRSHDQTQLTERKYKHSPSTFSLDRTYMGQDYYGEWQEYSEGIDVPEEWRIVQWQSLGDYLVRDSYPTYMEF